MTRLRRRAERTSVCLLGEVAATAAGVEEFGGIRTETAVIVEVEAVERRRRRRRRRHWNRTPAEKNPSEFDEFDFREILGVHFELGKVGSDRPRRVPHFNKYVVLETIV